MPPNGDSPSVSYRGPRRNPNSNNNNKARPARTAPGTGLAEVDTDEGIQLNPDQITYTDYKNKFLKGGKYFKTGGIPTLYPVRSHPKKESYSPLDYHGLISFMTVRFLNNIFYHTKANLDPEDLFPHSKWDQAYYNGLRFDHMWNEEVKRKGLELASLGKVCFRYVRTRLIVMFSALLFSTSCLLFVTSVMTNLILKYISEKERNDTYGIGLSIITFFIMILRLVVGLFFFLTGCRTATRLKTGVLSIVFQKIARLRSLRDKSVGEVVNICANDSQRIFDVTIFGNYVVVALVLIVGILVSLYFIIGWSGVIGTTGTFLVFWPLQVVFGRITTYLREKCIVVTDERVQKMNEVLTYVKLIKMYAWEVPFSKSVAAIRSREKGYLEKAGYMQSFSISITPINPNIATVFTILVHLAMGNTLTATDAFTLVAVLNTLRAVMGATPWSIRSIAESQVALRRLKSILVMEDMSPLDTLPENDKYAVLIRNATFAWDKIEKEAMEEDDEPEQSDSKGMEMVEKAKKMPAISANHINIDTTDVDDIIRRSTIHKKNPYDSEMILPVLFGVNLKLEKGRLTGCCGGVGAGKSSLISAILGQLHTLEGSCLSRGKFAYAAQEAWLFNATLRENILFGKPFDKKKYNMVIYNCCLGPDLEILPYGDQTEIGERGLNMSGGQKQRISLARALYSDRDIFLLDDPLSAVDAHVGKHIFEHYIAKGLKGKTVLFMTHQLQYLKDCEVIITLAGGRIVETGNHKDLMQRNMLYAELIRTFHHRKEEEEDLEGTMDEAKDIESLKGKKERAMSDASARSRASSVVSDAVLTAQVDEGGGGLIKAEVRATEAVGSETYVAYVKSMGGWHMVFLVLFFFGLMFFTMTFNNYWLSYWLDQGAGDPDAEDPEDISVNENLLTYELIYVGSLLLIIVFGAIKSLVFMKLTLRASSHMHDTVFFKVFRSPMSFFDTTPVGRVLNRFSKDLDEVDVLLPLNLELAIQNILVLFFAVLVVCISFPILIAIVIPCMIMFLVILRYYRRGIRDLKRIENITRSPWFSHISATVSGLSTIHAYEKTDDFILRFRELMDDNSLPYMLFRMCTRWAGVRLEIMAVWLQFATCLMIVLSHGNISSSDAGLAMSYTIQFTGMLQLLILMASETEARFTSVERIQSYMRTLVSEAPPRIKGKVPKKGWPHRGKIEFKKYSMRYRDGLPLVIKAIDLTIEPCEKIGIVGRTGSGKSSLGIGLFRLVEPAGGEIIIDDICCGEIGLRDLRSRLSIIPQDPVLFYGTVRYNLDPFQEHTDKVLWDSLEQAFMKDRIRNIDNRLDAMVAEGGDNFSVGERQLLCMARALLRNSKILMLDEATAAIDTHTDSLIQNTIRTAFNDCTMLIIAHRLNTILDADKVLVMSDGHVAEFDTPANLLANAKGVFSGMVAAAESAAN